ncbi:TPA: hypothetical protein PPN70_004108 [Serratia rubidaea]|nr:hypothetical protein [Serratia rubidaea]HDJ1448913.1 hypothetical protein [Serratia rubidaea]HDJ1462607.1 hypothetical protein [Serratia rubidaea]HDJ2772096.1 hypothetical protein [Serratia rubidaea]
MNFTRPSAGFFIISAERKFTRCAASLREKNSLNKGKFSPDKYRHTLPPQAADIYHKIRPLQWNILPSPPIILIIGNFTIAKIMPDANRRSRHL